MVSRSRTEFGRSRQRRPPLISAFKKTILLPTLLQLGGIWAFGRSDAETRVLDYIRDHLRPGEPLVVTELYNQVFTQSDERRTLDKLYNAFFRIPLFIAQYQERFGNPPSLKVIAEQFDLRGPEAADVLIRVMESDPRVPRFLARDPKTGEITRLDREKILSDPRFGRVIERQLGAWEGKPAPNFKLPEFAGGEVDLANLRNRATLLYIWFTGCPPCMNETPKLVSLAHEFPSLVIVGANADRILGLAYDDAVRRRYAEEQKISFPLVHWTREADNTYGNIAIFPTLFLIDRNGLIASHWIGYVSSEELRRTIAKILKSPETGQ